MALPAACEETPLPAATLDDQSALLAAAYDPANFGACAHAFAERLTAYLERAVAEPAPSLDWRPPAELVGVAERLLHEREAPTPARFGALAEAFLAGCHRLHSACYIGHQVPPPIPLAGLFDALGSVVNQSMSIYEMGPFSVAAEKALVRELCRRIGWAPGTADGFASHGGSLSNFTALLAARAVRRPDSWRGGTGEGPPLAVLVGADAHYSVTRALGMMGLGADRAVKVPLDARRRMDPARLPEAAAAARARGWEPFALVASACTTATGAFDPLPALADFAAAEGLWLHVDGAHGASALLSRRHRHLLAGLERCDSLTWDAHKMLFVPALCTFTLFKDAGASYAAFQQDAPYLFDPDNPGQAEYDVGLRTVECTKRSAALGLWGAWSMFGPELFEALVDRTFGVARAAYEMLAAAPDFFPCHEPECNILCFRHVPVALAHAPPETVSEFQAALRRRLTEQGPFYITQTRLDGAMALRIAVMNPHTGPAEIGALMDTLRALGLQQLERAAARAPTKQSK